MSKKLIYMAIAAGLFVTLISVGQIWAAHGIVTISDLASDGAMITGNVTVATTTSFAQVGTLKVVVFEAKPKAALREVARANLGEFGIEAAGMPVMVPFSIEFDRQGKFIVVASFKASRVNEDGTMTLIGHTHASAGFLKIEEAAEAVEPEEPEVEEPEVEEPEEEEAM